MKLRPILFGVLAALIGIVLQVVYMRRFEQEASGGARVELLVAAQPIERGNPITAEMLGVRAVPQAYVDDRAIRAADRDKVLNLRAASKVPVLQTLAWTDFIATTDDQRDLSSLVQPGNRALPIKIQYDEALQLIRPGDFVDILGVDSEQRGASVLLQRVLVLATGLDTTIERSTDKKPLQRSSMLTVSVSLQEAQLLALAQSISRLTVILRNSGDPRVFDSPPDISRTELFDTQVRQNMVSAHHRPVRVGKAAP